VVVFDLDKPSGGVEARSRPRDRPQGSAQGHRDASDVLQLAPQALALSSVSTLFSFI